MTHSFHRSWQLRLAAIPILISVAHGGVREAESWPLDSGTTLVLVEDHRAPLVHLVIEFPVGSWSSWGHDSRVGQAVEALLHDPDGELRRRADGLGVVFAVARGSHSTRLSTSFLRDDLDEVLVLVRDVLSNRTFDRKELRRRKTEASFLWKAALKDPWFRLGQATAEVFFEPDDPRRRRYGKPASVRTDTGRLAAAADMLERLPGRVVAFAGDLTGDAARAAAQGLLPPLTDAPPAGLGARVEPMMTDASRPEERTVAVPRVAQVLFRYSRPSLTYEDPRYPAFKVADHVLAGHFHSRLYEALRHDGGQTYGSGSDGWGGVDRQAYGLWTYTRIDNADAAEGKLRETVGRFQQEGITEEERRAATGYLLGRRPFSRQSPAQVLGRFLFERRHALPPGFLDDLDDRASRVPLGEVNALIRDFYDPSHFTMIRVTPD